MFKMLRPDSKGRITLGHLADGISGFSVIITKDQKIILFINHTGKSFDELGTEKTKKSPFKAMGKAQGCLEINPRNPASNAHKFVTLTAPNGEEIIGCSIERT